MKTIGSRQFSTLYDKFKEGKDHKCYSKTMGKNKISQSDEILLPFIRRCWLMFADIYLVLNSLLRLGCVNQ